jgi:hypothetical protein
MDDLDMNNINCYPPFSKKTLECDVNCLIFDKLRGLSISPKLLNNMKMYKNIELPKIIDNIRSKKMLIFNDIAHHRLEHMISKGWNIGDIHTNIFLYDRDEIFDDVCIICNENFQDNDLKIRINHTKCKCNIRYCIGCLNQMHIKKMENCPCCNNLFEHCKDKFNVNNVNNVYNELYLLRRYFEVRNLSFLPTSL